MNKTSIKNREKLLGKEFETNNCGKCFIVDYKGSKKVTVMFYNPIYATQCTMQNLRIGRVVNPFYPTVCGIGYKGLGRFNCVDHKRVYFLWVNALTRTTQKFYKIKCPSYEGVEVCAEWLNFQNFAKWYYEQPFLNAKDDIGNFYHLDKDILHRGNKVYSPETCCFVPPYINTLVLNRKAKRGDHVVGVSFDRENNKFRASINFQTYTKNLGRFTTETEAFRAYKRAKEAYIKEVAEKWKGKIDDRVYENLINWEISMED